MKNTWIAYHARAAGMTYFIGSACKVCGNQWRYTKSTGFQCVECRRAGNNKYRKQNKEKCETATKVWRNKNASYYRTWKSLYEAHGASKSIKYGAEK